MWATWVSLACVCSVLCGSTCHKPTATPPAEQTEGPDQANASPNRDKESEAPSDPPQEDVVWPVAVDDPDRWLYVEGIRNGAAGAWATGSFDPKRNKLDIRTRDVRKFAIDTGRIPIDWERVVILGIDGANSELRRRDFQLYHFALSEHGRWIVLEP
jgi:hypothetical protein